jgi:hypothetical protein
VLPAGVKPAVAVSVEESVGRPLVGLIVRSLDHVLLAQRPAGGHEPLLPFEWGLGFMIVVEERVPACWAAVALSLEQLQGVLVQRRGLASAPTFSPVLDQGRVVRRRRPRTGACRTIFVQANLVR